jgi:hypothetical protein
MVAGENEKRYGVISQYRTGIKVCCVYNTVSMRWAGRAHGGAFERVRVGARAGHDTKSSKVHGTASRWPGWRGAPSRWPLADEWETGTMCGAVGELASENSGPKK